MNKEEIIKTCQYGDLLIIRDKVYEYRCTYKKIQNDSCEVELCNKYRIGENKNFYERVIGNRHVSFKLKDVTIEKAQFKTDYKKGDMIYVKYDSRSTCARDNLDKTLVVTETNGFYVKTNYPKCMGIYNFEIEPYIKTESYSII